MQASFTSMGGRPTALRPDVDFVLSLKKLIFKSVMFDCFVRLGGKDTNQNNNAEKETAREALREPRAFLVACRDVSCHKHFYAEPDEVDYQVYDLIGVTWSGERSLVHFDGATQRSFQAPPAPGRTFTASAS